MNDLGQEAKALIAENLPFEETLIAMSENKIRYLNRVNKQFYIDLMTYYTKKEKKNFLTRWMRIRKKVSVSCLIFSIEGGKKEKWI